jgi:hypothetical protein
VLHLDVIKVDHDVTHVAMAIHVYFKCMFQMFHLFFHTFIASASSGCCICLTRMLQLFYLDVAYVCNGFQEFSCAFASVSHALLQVFQLFRMNVANVSSGYFKSRSGCCTCCNVTHLPQLPVPAACASCMRVG